MAAREAIGYLSNGGEVPTIVLNTYKSNDKTSVAVGYNTLISMTGNTSQYNVGIGYNSLLNCSGGGSNVAIGANALEKETNSLANVAIGSSALTKIDTAALTAGNNSGNVAIGVGTLSNADGNPAIGYTAGNVAIGFNAGNTLQTGLSNTIIGSNAQTVSPTTSNQIALSGNTLYIPGMMDYGVSAPNTLTVNGYITATGLPSHASVSITNPACTLTATPLTLLGYSPTPDITITSDSVILPQGKLYKIDYFGQVSPDMVHQIAMYFAVTGGTASVSPPGVTVQQSITSYALNPQAKTMTISGIVSTMAGQTTIQFYCYDGSTTGIINQIVATIYAI